jgi:EAL domain-containing protein (putative c-di-GMP-specific phosphodiesterase class I)
MGRDGSDASGMLRSANSAMAHALGHGGNRFRFVAQDMNDRASRMFALEAELRRALVHNEFVLHYQPRAALSDDGLAGAEALVRWQHPTRGLVPPADFLPLAESSGLIVPLGAWVIREACRQQRAWRDAEVPMVPISINLSPRQFREEGLVEHIEVALEEYDVPSAMLSFEITEAMVKDNLDEAVAKLNELKTLGVRLSLGDFGTGHSSLARLRMLPVDQLKIDQSFVRQLGSEQADEAICRSIIDLGHNLNMQIVGEGVETLLQREWLRDHYCDEIQGCFFARPMAAEDLAQLLAADRPRSNTMLPLWIAINYKASR